MTEHQGGAEHTPGPWYVTGSDPNGGMVFANDNTPVAAWPTHTDSAQQMANARLIAAAPELLAALKWALFVIELAQIEFGPLWVEDNIDAGDAEGDPQFMAGWNQARTAIEAAEAQRRQ